MKLTADEFAEIEFDVSEDGATARLRGRQIGEVTIEYDDLNRTACIKQMFVDAEYQQNGIGLSLIEGLHAEFGVLGPPPMEGWNVTTTEGAKLVNKAIERGWVRGWWAHEGPDDEE